jgi:uncharacterized damage-inducible protein DinB
MHPTLEYFESVRTRSLRVMEYIPEDKLDWSYQSGKFTPGDVCRHLALVERRVFAQALQGLPPEYHGCGKEFGATKAEIKQLIAKLHAESLEIFNSFSAEEMEEKALTPDGKPITRWKLVRIMTEHEVHHRGQLYMYLGLLGVSAPPVLGLTAEELVERSVRA